MALYKESKNKKGDTNHDGINNLGDNLRKILVNPFYSNGL